MLPLKLYIGALLDSMFAGRRHKQNISMHYAHSKSSLYLLCGGYLAKSKKAPDCNTVSMHFWHVSNPNKISIIYCEELECDHNKLITIPYPISIIFKFRL